MTRFACFLVLVGYFALVMYAGGIVYAITEYVLRKNGFYDYEQRQEKKRPAGNEGSDATSHMGSGPRGSQQQFDAHGYIPMH